MESIKDRDERELYETTLQIKEPARSLQDLQKYTNKIQKSTLIYLKRKFYKSVLPF